MAIMLPVAAGMTMGESAARSDSPSAPPDKLHSGPADSSSQARQTSSASDETGTQTTRRAADAKREGQDSSEDIESAKPTRTRSKSSFSDSNASQVSGDAAQSGQPFASVFADAVKAARTQPQPHVGASILAAAVSAQGNAPVPSELRLGQPGVVPATPEIAASAGLPATASSASSNSAHFTNHSVQAEPSKASSRAAERVLQANAAGEPPVPPTSALQAVRLTLPANSTAASTTYAFKSDPPVIAVQSSVAQISPAAAPQVAIASETTPGFNGRTALGQTPAAAIIAATGVNTESVGEPLGATASGQAALAVTGVARPNTAPNTRSSAATTALSATTSTTKSPLLGGLMLKSLQVPSSESRLATPSTGENAAAMLSPDSDITAKYTLSAALESPSEEARRVSKSGDNAPTTSQSSSVVAGSALQPNQPGSVVAAPDNNPVAQSGIQERIDVAQQLATRISAAASAASGGLSSIAVHKLTVDITPQHWGRMQITLTQSPASAGSPAQSTATIVTESESARQAMMGQVKELHDSLQAGGVKIDKIEIVAAAKPGAATSSDSVVASVGGASAGTLSGNAQQQSQSHHSHSGQRFEFGSGAGAGGSSNQSGRERNSGSIEGDLGANGSYRNSGLSSQSETAGNDNAPQLQLTGVGDANAGVNVLA